MIYPVTNPVQELAYTWSTTDGNVASVENGKVTAKGEGSADISVTNGVKTKTVSVNVSKNQINGFSMTVKEPSGDDQSSVILTAKGLPADVSGNVIFYDVTGGQKLCSIKQKRQLQSNIHMRQTVFSARNSLKPCIAVMKNMKARRQQQPEVMGNTGNYDRR